MIANERVGTELVSVVAEGFLVLFKRAVGVCAGNGFHGFKVLACVFDGLLRGHDLVYVVHEVEHDLAEEHVLECRGGFFGLVLCVVPIQSFDEVGEGCVEIFVFGV